MSTTMEVGKKLVELCKAGDFCGAVDALYSPNIVSVEAQSMPGMPQRIEGLANVRRKSEEWARTMVVHGSEIDGPYPHGDRFIVTMKMDCTAKEGPMAGKRMQMNEGCLYTVKDGKIVQEEFFYHFG